MTEAEPPTKLPRPIMTELVGASPDNPDDVQAAHAFKTFHSGKALLRRNPPTSRLLQRMPS
jgi:hypothetical protein